LDLEALSHGPVPAFTAGNERRYRGDIDQLERAVGGEMKLLADGVTYDAASMTQEERSAFDKERFAELRELRKPCGPPERALPISFSTKLPPKRGL
jgi:hypothetical protein